MTKLTAISLLALMVTTPLLAQQESEAPDYQYIRQQTCNSRCADFYPNLMQRYQQCDTTLSLEDYRNLYYGFALQEDFVPYQKENEAALEARELMVKNGASAEVCPQAIAKAQEALLNDPFDLTALSVIPICYSQMGDSANFQLWDQKLHGILDAISSSGDGESAETAYHVINVEHEYEIMNRQHLELTQVEVVNGNIDFVRVKENSDSIPGIYFNFSACSNAYKQKYK